MLKIISKQAAQDFYNTDVRRLDGALLEIREQVSDALTKLEQLRMERPDLSFEEARMEISYNLDMIEGMTGRFKPLSGGLI